MTEEEKMERFRELFNSSPMFKNFTEQSEAERTGVPLNIYYDCAKGIIPPIQYARYIFEALGIEDPSIPVSYLSLMPYGTMGNFLTQVMYSSRMSIEEVAKLTDVDEVTVGYWRNNIECPSLQQVKVMCEKMDCCIKAFCTAIYCTPLEPSDNKTECTRFYHGMIDYEDI